MVFESNSMKETKDFAAKFSKTIKSGKIIALNGGLGAGKTTFAQGFAIGMGIEEHVGSPTSVSYTHLTLPTILLV